MAKKLIFAMTLIGVMGGYHPRLDRINKLSSITDILIFIFR
jgi:hypothetical protein